MAKLRAPLQWVGGKSRLVDWILPNLAVPCTCYCEPFGGSAAVLLNRRHSEVEVYNDLDGALATLMLCVKEHPAELQRLIAELPYSREHYKIEERWRKLGCPGRMTDLQFAARWWWLTLTAFGGKLGSGFGTAVEENQPAKVESRVASIDSASRRLRRVLIESEDFRVILQRYDSPRTLFYCDPPYVGAEDVYQEGGFSEADHRELARLLNECEAKVALSYYPSPLVAELYPETRWRRLEKAWQTSLAHTRGKDYELPERTELLLMNYDPPGQDKLF